MSFTDMRSRFAEKYRGEIKDPILNILLDTIDEYQQELMNKQLISTYTSWSSEIGDGLFEVLRRHLFGQMYPGPVFTVVQASLRGANEALPVKLESFHHFSLQDMQGNKIFFSPLHETWIIPAHSNTLMLKQEGEDLLLGFNVVLDNIEERENMFLSVFADQISPLLLERIKCRISIQSGYFESNKERKSIFRSPYPSVYGLKNEFFETPHTSRFIQIPVSLLFENKSDDGVWIRLEGLAPNIKQLDKKLTMNTMPFWNMVEKEVLAIKESEGVYFRITELNMEKHETMISSVKDIGYANAVEYIDSSVVMDPSYPYQFTSLANNDKDSIVININPEPKGNLRVNYYQYDTSDYCTDIPAGRSFMLTRGLDEDLHNVQSLIPTARSEALFDKKGIWSYFRSMLASRNRLLTRDDLKAAITSYPPLAGISDIFRIDLVEFTEKTGRVRGFLTTYTEITIPVSDHSLLKSPDKSYFEREIGYYLKQKSVSGNYLQVKLKAYEDTRHI